VDSSNENDGGWYSQQWAVDAFYRNELVGSGERRGGDVQRINGIQAELTTVIISTLDEYWRTINPVYR
jgi:hypothetical protein